MAVSMLVVGVVSFYMVAALVMVIVNKLVMNAAPNLTIFFMFIQSITTVLLLNITALFTSHVQIPTLDLATARKLAPLILIDAAGFIFNALCLRDVEAAFYQVARGLVLPLTITVVSISSRTKPPLQVIGCAAVVTCGFLYGVSFPQNLPPSSIPTPLALTYGFLASLSIAVHAVMVKTCLSYVNGSPTMLSYWCNLGASVFVGGLALMKGEIWEFQRMVGQPDWDWQTFLWGNVVTCIFGFLISVAGILSVKVTSPVTHMFSSAARSVLQVFLGVRIFGDVMTTQRATSVFIILIGTLLFTYVKTLEPPKSPKSSQAILPVTAKEALQKEEEIPLTSEKSES